MRTKIDIGRDDEYFTILSEIKNKIQNAQIRAAISVNKELLSLYWDIGKIICLKQKEGKYGDSIVEMLAEDLKKEFPTLKGFSRTNLFNIRQWYIFYSRTGQKVQQLVGQLPWGHNILILNKIENAEEAYFYLVESIRNNWSRTVLSMNIENNLYHRKGNLTNNFDSVLPKPQSDLAIQTLKDPYIFDFLSLGEEAQEKEIEKELINNVTKFLLELGTGFSYVGKQVHIEVGKEDFFIDLLFFHLNLRCFIVIELKAGDFKPEYVGKINFYLNAVDNLLKHPSDNPSIGLILCKNKNRIIAEYALKNIAKPIGVSEYKMTKLIDKKLKSSLPSIKCIENELSKTK